MTETPQLNESEAGRLEAPAPSWQRYLGGLERFVLLFYALSLPLSISLSQILLIIGLLLSALDFALAKLRGRQAEQSRRAPVLLLPLSLFAAAVTISGALGGNSSPSLSDAWEAFCSLKTLLPYFWAASVFSRNPKLPAAALILLLWVSAVAGVWGSIQQVFNIHPGYKYLQGTGFLSHPMAFAGQMQIFSFISLGLLLSKGYCELLSFSDSRFLNPLLKLSQNKTVFLLLSLANFSGLFFAGERSAWLGAVFGILSLTVLISWRLAAGALAAMTLGSAFAWFFVPLLRSRVESIFSGHDVSVSARQKIWSVCLNEYFPKSPLYGIGWMKFPHFDIPEAIVPGVSKDLIHAHSNYIHILSSAGLLGLSAYIYLLIAIWLAAYLNYKNALLQNQKLQAGVALGLFAAAVSLAVSGFFEFNFGTAQVRLAQWFVFALL
ncbi:MAG: O-antigen ligase family protein [Candidatus Obscuribacterales bacterium]|nr:O-antigen ligase family protein [Candidatus Obscuribacterales bacterium]